MVQEMEEISQKEEMSDFSDEIAEEAESNEEYMQTLHDLTDSLIKRRDEAVAFRAASGVERRWREDERLLEGSLDYPNSEVNMLDYATQEAPATTSSQPNRSMIEINIVRHKCETAIGRFSDIMLPTDGKNWGLKVTPVPELEEALKDERIAARKETKEPVKKADGKEAKISDIAQKELREARKRMGLMETEIDDQLTECNYNGEQRKVIKHAVDSGTGILRGPNVVKKTQKVYRKDEKGNYKLTIKEKHQPVSEAVSKWNIYPDPDTTENVKETMSYVFERQDIRPKDLYDLIGLKGYMSEQIKMVLEESPKRTEVSLEKKSDQYRAMQKVVDSNELYEMWIFYGDLNREDLEVIGIDTSESPEAFKLSVCIVMVNDYPIKVMLNPLDSGDLPYDFFQWSQVSGSPWGIGLPRMMMWIQHMINGAMRAMMDNAGDSSGVNVIMSSDIAPVDDKWELTGKKLWKYVGDDPQEIDVRKLFTQFQVANNQSELQNIIELAFKLLDLETGVPMIFQGEQQRAPETLGATNIMVDASNVALRARVKLFDDQITRPHLTKYYHWNMQYSDNDAIKGDFNVAPRGTSVLLQKDQHLRMLMQIMEFKNDPDFKLRVDWDQAIKELFEILGLNILRTDDQFKQMKQQLSQKGKPKDPKIQAAEIKAKAEIQDAKIRSQISEKDNQFKAKEAEQERQHKRDLKLIERDIKMMELAEKRGMNLDQIKGKLSSDKMKLKTQIALTDAEGKAPQVSKPAVEPKGRAPDDEAFTK